MYRPSVSNTRLKIYFYLYLFDIKYHNLNLAIFSYNTGDIFNSYQ
jgi:hypothetical protein